MLPVGSYWEWEGGLHGNMHRVITGVDDAPLGICPQEVIDRFVCYDMLMVIMM